MLHFLTWMLKHINEEHDGLKENVKFSWRVIRKHSKPLQRQLHEAIRIKNKKDKENLNTKFEFNGQRITRKMKMISGLWYTHVSKFGSLSWIWRCKEHPCHLSPDLGTLRMLEVPDWGLASWSWFGYGHWSLIHSWSKFWLSIWILNIQKTSKSFKSWFRALDDARGSWLGFCILILIWIWLVVFDTTMIWILALHLDFEGAKNIHVL